MLSYLPGGNISYCDHSALQVIRRTLVIVIAVLLVSITSLTLATEAESNKRPVPSRLDLTASEKLVNELFHDQFARLKPLDRSPLAASLLEQGGATNGDDAAKFVLLRQARDVAAAAGDLRMAFKAADKLADSFDVDRLETKAAAIALAAPAAKLPKNSGPISEVCLELCDTALAQDRLDIASRAVSMSEDAARLNRNAGLLAKVSERRRAVRDAQAQHERYTAAVKKLGSDPENPEANLVVGRFLCFRRHAWTDGLSKLVKGSDPALKDLAIKELTAPTEPEAMAALGDSWWAFRDPNGAVTESDARQRAAEWYSQALPGTKGLKKSLVEKRIAEARHAQSMPSPAIDLLATVDPARDAVSGAWKLEGGKLTSSGDHAFEKIQFSQSLPTEYDFRIVFSRVKGNDSVVQVCTVGDQTICWAMACFENTVMGFGEVNGMGLQNNATTIKSAKCFENGREYTSVVKVRRNSLEAFVDGKLVAQLDTRNTKLNAGAQLGLPNPKAIGLVTNSSSAQFRSVEVLPVDGASLPDPSTTGK